MRRTTKIATALLLGLALTGAVGAAVVYEYNQPAPSGTQVNTNFPNTNNNDTITNPTGDMSVFSASDPASAVGLQPAPTTNTPQISGPYAIGLAVAWGYIPLPMTMREIGTWNTTSATTGVFMGAWHQLGSNASGPLQGDLTFTAGTLNGTYAGTWDYASGMMGGSMSGVWRSFNDTSIGYFVGQWTYASGASGGAMKGLWRQNSPDGGAFAGISINRPTMDRVNWNGSLSVENGIVVPFTTIGTREFSEDNPFTVNEITLLPRQSPSELSWQSVTTTGAVGLIAVIRVDSLASNVTLQVGQWTETFTAAQLLHLGLNTLPDSAGHGIVLRGFPIRMPEVVQPQVVKLTLTLMWGYLPQPNPPGEGQLSPSLPVNYTAWNGFVQVTRGTVSVKQTIDWETGGTYQNGSADMVFPRTSPSAVVWRSSVTDDWDGLMLSLTVPVTGTPMFVTVHAGAFTHIYTLQQLDGSGSGFTQTYSVGSGGEQVQVTATLA